MFWKRIVIGLLQGVFGASQLGCLGLATSGHAMEFEPCGMNIHNQPLINCCSVKPRVERLVLIGSDSIPTCETMIFSQKDTQNKRIRLVWSILGSCQIVKSNVYFFYPDFLEETPSFGDMQEYPATIRWRRACRFWSSWKDRRDDKNLAGESPKFYKGICWFTQRMESGSVDPVTKRIRRTNPFNSRQEFDPLTIRQSTK